MSVTVLDHPWMFLFTLFAIFIGWFVILCLSLRPRGLRRSVRTITAPKPKKGD